MGEIRASVTLENRDDRGAVRLGLRAEVDVRRTTVEGVVDTGAVSLVIPEEIATELGLEKLGNENRRLRGRTPGRSARDRRHDRDSET